VTSTLITGIGELVTCDGTGEDGLGRQTGAAVMVTEDRIDWIGRAGSAPAADRQVDLGGRSVVPGFVDSHSHLVFAGDRGAKCGARMAGAYVGGGSNRNLGTYFPRAQGSPSVAPLATEPRRRGGLILARFAFDASLPRYKPWLAWCPTHLMKSSHRPFGIA
jgi:hypothetical protein